MPVYLKRNIHNSALLGVWEITETSEELLERISLNSEERKLFDGFRNETRRMHWLSYRVLLKELISEEEYSHVIYDEYGKPYLQIDSHFLSVTHSGIYSAAIVSREFPVGIDIEKLHPKIERVIHKFLSQKEVENIGTEHRLEKLYAYWGAKEALYKLFGEKDLIFQDHIHLSKFVYGEKGNFNGKLDNGKFQKKFILQYEKLNEYMLVYTVAS